MSGRVMVYVQHLLGIGHLKRTALIARAMTAAGLQVLVVLGGREVPGIDFTGCARILLPPAHAADETFSTLLDEHDQPIDDAWRDHRVARLLFEYEALRPDVLMIETFPFGRRMFAYELMPLLAAARATPRGTAGQRPPRIVSSVRDILVRKADPVRNQQMVALAHAWFDRILVHGDPRLIAIEASFPEMSGLAAKLDYTGYVAADIEAPPDPPSPIGAGEVVVSVGGGAAGLPLLRAALAARPLSALADRVWRLITGPNLPALFRTCAASISQAGYNTVMDLLQAGTRAVLVPFADGAETEQSLRARILAERGLAISVDPATLSPIILARALDRALTLPPASVEIDRRGATTTARLVCGLCGSAAGA